jgi:hypothetical protein
MDPGLITIRHHIEASPSEILIFAKSLVQDQPNRIDRQEKKAGTTIAPQEQTQSPERKSKQTGHTFHTTAHTFHLKQNQRLAKFPQLNNSLMQAHIYTTINWITIPPQPAYKGNACTAPSKLMTISSDLPLALKRKPGRGVMTTKIFKRTNREKPGESSTITVKTQYQHVPHMP